MDMNQKVGQKCGGLKHQNRKNYENGRKKKRKEKPKISLILSHVNHTFLILNMEYIGHGISNIFAISSPWQS